MGSGQLSIYCIVLYHWVKTFKRLEKSNIIMFGQNDLKLYEKKLYFNATRKSPN